MPCCGDREKLADMRAEQKWDYITLKDFRSTTCWTPLSYGILYISVLISVAVYAVDTFTAVNLLAFSRWAGKIKPAIPFNISRWIFAGCIILSFVLLIYRWIRAVRIIKAGGVAQSYLDPLAVRVQSVRMGRNGQGWRRFLVFAELTKSKKGAEYVALFTYFSFEAWLRVVFADGPRQVINAITLYSVMQSDLLPEGDHAAEDGTSPVAQFFDNIRVLADEDNQGAAIMFGMLFTLVIWVFTMLGLLISVVLYLLFLWHHIPSSDGSLSAYCHRKINARLERIVNMKVDKALAKDIVLQDRNPTQPNSQFTPQPGDYKRQPTLPTLDTSGDKLPNMPLSRQTTQTTLPPYSNPPTAGGIEKTSSQQPTLPDLGWSDQKSMPPSRGGTLSSNRSEDSTPLVSNASGMGYSPAPSFSNAQPLPRSYTPSSRPPTAQSRQTPGPSPVEYPGRRTPGMGYPGPGGGHSQPPSQPPSVGRRTPGGPPPNRDYFPPSGSSTPQPFGGGYASAAQSSRTPDPSRWPPPTAFSNVNRPSTTSPSNEFGNNPPPPNRMYPRRTGTAPPSQHPPGYNNF